jgi:hypothetical protein
VLTQLRRRALHDLAKAYRIDIPDNGTKDEILPALHAAEKRGVFRGPPIDPYYFLKAQRDPDKLEPLPPGAVPLDTAHRPPADPSPPSPAGPSMGELRAACKANGINSFAMSKQAMQEALDAIS